MSYNGFAYHYDKMMADVDYGYWLHHIQENIKLGGRVLDVGCGTGTLSLALKHLGYDVLGIDASEDMLVVATEKARESNIDIEFIQRDMRQLSGLSGFDCVLIAVDSLNYLETEKDVQHTLAGCHSALNEGGVLIFDVHTPEKMTHLFKDYLYVENDDELTYIWHIEEGEAPLSVVHELTIFSKNEDGSYMRTVEYHLQRTYEFKQYEHWLCELGFELLLIEDDGERGLFITRKVDDLNAT